MIDELREKLEVANLSKEELEKIFPPVIVSYMFFLN